MCVFFIQKRGKKRWIFGRIETAKCANSSAVRICGGEESSVWRKQPRMEEAAAAAAAAEENVLVREDKAAILIQRIFRGYLVIIISEFSFYISCIFMNIIRFEFCIYN